MDQNRSSIVVFARAPVYGQVKTRLAKSLDPSMVVNLYRCFGRDIIDKIIHAGFCPKIFYDPPEAENLMSDWLGGQHAFYPQQGRDLGMKMANAIKTVFEEGIIKAILLGTDFPDLPEKILSEAVCRLEDHDGVIGPATDGGYYLIGCRTDTFLPAVFENIPWGTSLVYQKTMDVFAKSGANIWRLPEWRDVDEFDDLIDLVKCLRRYPDRAKHTRSYLASTGLLENQTIL